MILFSERATYINILHVHMKPELSVENIGCIRQTHFIGCSAKTWKVAFIGRNLIDLSDSLDDSEKRQIIGMVEKLNGHIIGQTEDDCCSDNFAQRWKKLL